MLDRAGDADGHVQLRAHDTARLADLIAVRSPSFIRHRASRADRGIAEGLGELLDEPEILRRLEPSPAAHDHRGLAQIGARGVPLHRLLHHHA